MPYQVTKKPWLGAILVLFLGPFGFLYYSWRKALVTFLLFFLPNLTLHQINTTSATVLSRIIQAVLAAFAYFDISDRLEVIGKAGTTFIQILSVPVMFLNFFGSIAGGIWLLFLGQWRLVLGAFIVTFLVPFLYGIVSIVQLPVVALLSYAESKRKKALCLSAGFVNVLIGHAFILAYVILAMDYMCAVEKSSSINIFALLLFGYGIATSPFSYMASKDGPESTGSIMGVFLAQISYIIFATAYLLDNLAIAIPIVLIITFGIETFLMHLTSSAWDFDRDQHSQSGY